MSWPGFLSLSEYLSVPGLLSESGYEMKQTIFLSLFMHSLLIPLLLEGGFGMPDLRVESEVIQVALVTKADDLSVQKAKKEVVPTRIKKTKPEAGMKPGSAEYGRSEEITSPVQRPLPESVPQLEIEASGISGPDSGKTESHEELTAQGEGNEVSGNISRPGTAVSLTERNAYRELPGPTASHHQSGIRPGLEALRMLRIAIDKAKEYPRTAKRRGLEGTAITEFTINSRGFPEDIRIAKSSGVPILDLAAKETIMRAAPLPRLDGLIEIPITFRLQE
jgi:TonB family protein